MRLPQLLTSWLLFLRPLQNIFLNLSVFCPKISHLLLSVTLRRSWSRGQRDAVHCLFPMFDEQMEFHKIWDVLHQQRHWRKSHSIIAFPLLWLLPSGWDSIYSSSRISYLSHTVCTWYTSHVLALSPIVKQVWCYVTAILPCNGCMLVSLKLKSKCVDSCNHPTSNV